MPFQLPCPKYRFHLFRLISGYQSVAIDFVGDRSQRCVVDVGWSKGCRYEDQCVDRYTGIFCIFGFGSFATRSGSRSIADSLFHHHRVNNRFDKCIRWESRRWRVVWLSTMESAVHMGRCYVDPSSLSSPPPRSFLAHPVAIASHPIHTTPFTP
jgi:hypothetical protein